MKRGELIGAIEGLEREMRRVAAMVAEPSGLDAASLKDEFAHLERVWSLKAGVDAAFAYAAYASAAGGVAGRSVTLKYLEETLDISRSEASRRLERGLELYGEASAAAEPEVQKKARNAEVSDEKRKEINKALRNLGEEAAEQHMSLLEDSLSYAEKHSINDVRERTNLLVAKANAEAKVVDMQVAFRRRFISFKEPDAYGGVYFHGYLPGDMAAQLQEALNPARTAMLDGTDLELPEGASYGQRSVHLLVAACRNFLNSKAPNLRGVGSIVVSLTLDELENMTADSRFRTSTGHTVDPMGLIRLGEAKSDMFVLHDTNGLPLHADTGKRTASFYQRIALLASEQVCSAKGCTKPWSECEVHHIEPFSAGGETSIENLTLRCWDHHRVNNDYRDPGKPTGWAERDPVTGRVGTQYVRGGPIEVNDSFAAQQAAGEKIRRRYNAGEQESLFGEVA